MADYQYMQFQLVNSLRTMKSWGVNIVWTAWESAEPFTHPDGTQYTRLVPKISAKIVDNICGLCDVVGWIGVNKDGEHMVLIKPTQNILAKNQIDARESCRVEEFIVKKEAEK
jgi:phage nucleotide-binding protein